MADYINLNILSQSYIHIEPVNLEEDRLEEFQAYISDFITKRGQFFLYPEIEVDVALKGGSLKSYATILGTLYAVYLGIGNYGDFRQGIAVLYEDCKRLAETVCSESLFAAKARNPEVIRIEARTGVVGSLRKIISDLDSLKRLSGEISANEMAKRLGQTVEDTERLLENLKDSDDRKFVGKNLKAIVDETPQSPLPSRKRGEMPVHFAIYRENRKRLLIVLSKVAP